MAELNLLNSQHGFHSGEIDTSGYLAVIPAFQKVYIATGKPKDEWGYSKIDFINTKITGTPSAAFTKGEYVSQATSGAAGFYDECIDIKITGTLSDVFTLGELVIQDNTGAKGYVAFSGSGFINVYPIDVPSLFDATSENTITGQTSGSTLTTLTAITDKGVGRYHFIYRTTTTEFDTTNIITGNTSGSTLTLDISAVSEVQTYVPDSIATDGTYTITYNGQETDDLDYDATTDDIESALESLDGVSDGDITITGTIFSDGTDGITATFADTLGDTELLIFNIGSLTGVSSITSEETTKGVSVIQSPPNWLPWIPTSGDLPDGGSNIGCLCFGRIFLNSMLNPNQWYCSRVFDPLDFDTSQDDIAASTYSQNSKAGEVGDAMVAMIPYKDHYLIWGCANEMWILQSDPLMGGVNRCLSKSTGIFSPTSYCWDDKNNLYFIGIDGIYKLSSDSVISAQPPENITKERIPKLITSLKINRRTDRISMAYDKQRYGVEVCISQMDGEWYVNFWIDLRTGGIFPDKFVSGQEQSFLFYYNSYNAEERGLLLGGYDGYIRKFDETIKSDEGNNAIDSFVSFGPFVNNEEPRKTIDLSEISITTGEDTNGITIDLHKNKSGDAVINDVIDESTPTITKVLSGDNLLNSIRNKISDRAVVIKLKNETIDEGWSMEDLNITLKESGRTK